MLVTYTAPNRAHHYAYATALAQAAVLHTFVSGFSRFSPRSPLPEVGTKLLRADQIQNLYLGSLRLSLPTSLSAQLGHWSKIWLDRQSLDPATQSDVFLFYSGAGLDTTRRVSSRTLCVVEAVNTHVLVQERILREEYSKLKLPFADFPRREVARRLKEYDTADAVLCPSTFVRKSFIDEGFPADRILTVPYGFDLPTADSQPEKLPGRFRVLYVGQVNVRKGLRYLVEAFARLRHPDKELWIVGPMTKLTGLEDIQIPANVRFLGVLKGEQLMNAYREASVFVLPSLEEGMGLVLGEALSHGLPVIATTNTGAAEIFRDEVEGFQIPICDAEAIELKLQLLADDAELLRKMSAAATERCTSLGGWSRSGALLVESLSSACQKLSRRHSAPPC